MDVIDLIGKALNIRSSQHKVISGNIANVETPGYKEKNVDFKKEMNRAMHSGLRSASGMDVEITESPNNDGLPSIDGNTGQCRERNGKIDGKPGYVPLSRSDRSKTVFYDEISHK